MLRAAFVAPVLALVSIPVPGQAAPAELPIQPGARVRVGNAGCSMNFVFEDADHRYVGTAGHCGGVGTIASDAAGEQIGPVVFSMNAYPNLDFALIQIDADRIDDVSPAMRVWGGPTGVAHGGPFRVEGPTAPGAIVRQHGYGTTFGDRPETRSRSGVLRSMSPRNWEAVLPCSGGDSGSGVTLDSGEAVGVLDVALLAPGALHPTIQAIIGKISPTCGGSTIENVLERLAYAGFQGISLVTAPLEPRL